MSTAVRLRARIFSALGIAAIIPLTSSAETGAQTYAETLCLTDNGDAVCPDPTLAAESLKVPDGCTLVSVDAEGTYADGQCCFPVTLQCAGDTGYEKTEYNDCGCYGRPFVLEGKPLQAAEVETEGWARGPSPELAGLTEAQRAALAAFWTENGLAEHSSVAGFARFVLDLCAHGAPSELVQRALVAGVEETHHARLCFGLASAYAGRPVGPGAMAMNGSAPVAPSLVALAVSTAREGAVGETLSAFLAAEMLARTTDAAAREVLEHIVRDETRHAELAWATLKWAVAVGGDEVREAVAAELAGASMRVSAEDHVDPVLVRHGLVPATVLRRAVADGLRDVIAPAAAALLGRASGLPASA